MPLDARRLFGRLGLERIPYQELHAAERVRSELARRALVPLTDLPVPQERMRRTKRLVVAVAGSAPQAGRTSLVAWLADAAGREGLACAAVELDAGGPLRSFFRRAKGVGHLAHAPRRALLDPTLCTACVAFASDTETDPGCDADARAREVADDLSDRLACALPPETRIALLDLPAAPGPLTEAALALADAALLLVPADRFDPAAFEADVRALGSLPQQPVVSRFDARDPEQRAVPDLVAGLLGEDQAPLVLHHDPVAVREALAAGPHGEGPWDSQLFHDVARLAAGLAARALDEGWRA